MDEIIDKAIEFVLLKRGEDVFFGFLHADKVRMNALYLAEIYGANPHLVQLAGLLHDVAFDSKNYSTHAIDSANEAKMFLKSINYPEKEANMIFNAIKKHDSRYWDGDFVPDSLLEKILSDAENIERLSPFGIMKYVVVCKSQGFSNKEIIKSTINYFNFNKAKMFFDEAKTKVEFDKNICEQFLKRILEQSKFKM
jgi:HD superfamily phosphodiesterase